MKIGHLTLARIWDDPEPEFKDCARCGIPLTQGSDMAQCLDCKGVNAYAPLPRQLGHGGFLPIDPAYEVSLHYPKQAKECPTMATLDALHIPYFNYMATSDPLAVEWAKNLPYIGGHKGDWPIVVISSHGEYVEHWSGFQMTKLNRIPAQRKRAIKMSQAPHDFVTRVPNREQVAA